MKNQNAIMLSKLEGFKEISELLETHGSHYMADHRWMVKGDRYTATELIPPVVYFDKNSQIRAFFNALEIECPDRHLEFCGMMSLRYSTLAINNESKDITSYDRNGKRISNFKSDRPNENEKWIYKLGDVKFAIGCNEYTSFESMSVFEFDRRIFNIGLQRFVSECRDMLKPVPVSDPVIDEEYVRMIKSDGMKNDLKSLLDALQKSVDNKFGS